MNAIYIMINSGGGLFDNFQGFFGSFAGGGEGLRLSLS